jgi:hypothetical protein
MDTHPFFWAPQSFQTTPVAANGSVPNGMTALIKNLLAKNIGGAILPAAHD